MSDNVPLMMCLIISGALSLFGGIALLCVLIQSKKTILDMAEKYIENQFRYGKMKGNLEDNKDKNNDVKSSKAKEKEDDENKKMVISILSGKAKDMTTEEIQKQRDSLNNDVEPSDMKSSPFTLVDQGVSMFRQITKNSLDLFLKSIMKNIQQFPQGCVFDEKAFDQCSLRYELFKNQ